MASTYSSNLGIELIGTGDQSGTWGSTTNTNLGTLIEQAISGYVTQAVTTGFDTSITIPNGATGVARNMYIELTGTGGASTNLIVPANKKLYFIFNNTSSGQVTVKVSGQTGISVPNGKKMVLVCNGTDIVTAENYVASLSSDNLSLTGNLSLSAGTANGVLYLNGSKVATSGSGLVFDGAKLIASGANEAIRIASGAPYYSFYNAAQSTQFGYIQHTGTDLALVNVQNGAMPFYVNNAEGMRLTSTGLGIGTASPGSKLHVVGSAQVSVTSGYNEIGLNGTYASASARVAAFRKNYDSPFDFNIYASVGSSGNTGAMIFWRDSANENARFDTSGNLGIGTASPATKLHVNTGAAGYGITVAAASQTSITYQLGIDSNSNLAFYDTNAAAQRLVLSTSGNLGLGVTPSAWGTTKALEFSYGSFSANSSLGTDVAGNCYYNGTNWIYRVTGVALRYNQATAGHSWHVASGTAGNAITFTQAMTLDTSGNLLVGGTSATTIPVLNKGVYLQSTTNNDVIGYSLFVNEGSNGRRGSMFLDDANGVFGWDVTASSGIPAYAWRSAGRTDMYLTASGDLGVGVTTPICRLDVRGQETTSYNTVNFGNGTDNQSFNFMCGRELTNGTAAGVASSLVMTIRSSGSSTGVLAFATGNTERGRFTAGGYFKASDAGTYVSATGSYHELRTDGSAGEWIARLGTTTSTAANCFGLYVKYENAAPNGTGNTFLTCDDNASGGTTRAAIRSNGGLANYQTNDVNLSDERVKHDIKPLGSMWDKFKALEIVTFKYKDQTHDDDNIGLIAQQVESVAPEFIDADGWGETPEDGVPLKSVYTADLYHASIKAVQEAMARIEQLEAKVAALESA